MFTLEKDSLVVCCSINIISLFAEVNDCFTGFSSIGFVIIGFLRIYLLWEREKVQTFFLLFADNFGPKRILQNKTFVNVEHLQEYLDFAKSTLTEVKEIGLLPKILVLVEGFKLWISEYVAFVHEDASLFWEAVKLGDYENAFGRLGISVPTIFSERDV